MALLSSSSFTVGDCKNEGLTKGKSTQQAIGRFLEARDARRGKQGSSHSCGKEENRQKLTDEAVEEWQIEWPEKIWENKKRRKNTRVDRKEEEEIIKEETVELTRDFILDVRVKERHGGKYLCHSAPDRHGDFARESKMREVCGRTGRGCPTHTLALHSQRSS